MSRTPSPPPSWAPTPAHVRAVVVVLVAAAVAVVARRPDVVVLVAPLVVVAVWSVLRRPSGAVHATQRLGRTVLREGDVTTWTVDVSFAEPGDADDVATALPVPPFGEVRPERGAVAVAVDGVAVRPDAGPAGDDPSDADGSTVPIAVPYRALRWGRQVVDPPIVVAFSAWGAFRLAAESGPPLLVSTLPAPAPFDAAAPGVHAPGLVGMERAPATGSGTEFAELRPFQPGDRLRRIDWARSSRTGTLHVADTWADHDRLVVLVVDATAPVGTSEGIDGRASSLDLSVRAAAALADHHLRRGDRVTLHVVGARASAPLPPQSGTRQLRRLLERLSTIDPASDRYDRPHLVSSLPSGALLIVLSPMLSTLALDRTVAAARRGLAVAVVDTFPVDLLDPDPAHPARPLAWRMRLLERDRAVGRARELGVPIVPWRGPGSLDAVLRDLHRRSRMPRLTLR